MHARTVLWRSEALEETPVLLRRSHPDEPCGIFHTPIPDVDVPGLGPWLENAFDGAESENAFDGAESGNAFGAESGNALDGAESENAFDGAESEDAFDSAECAAQLPCGHVFAVAALAVHCVVNDMRCPVCRRGPPGRAQISSLAAAMQPALLRKKTDVHAADAADAEDEREINVEALERDMRFELYLQWAPNGSNAAPDVAARLQTPIHRLYDTPSPALGPHLSDFATHRSFQRKFNLHLANMRPCHNVICVAVTHPLLLEPVRSALFDKHALLAHAAAGTSIPLCNGFGCVQPVASDAGIRLALHLNMLYVSMACLQTMADWTR